MSENDDERERNVICFPHRFTWWYYSRWVLTTIKLGKLADVPAPISPHAYYTHSTSYASEVYIGPWDSIVAAVAAGCYW